ncbi:MAG TPA: helix-turn-helix domain-containing protein [Bacteroidales bacterium]|nr:helix-turn-helix domain-containing protein [Bacteroidales bacterium]
MLTQENLIVSLYALPVYQSLFYTLQLITFKRAFPSRKYIGLVLLIMSVVLILNAVHNLGYVHLTTVLSVFFTPLLLSILPVFFLYIYSLTNENQEVTGWSRHILFIFPVLGLLVNISAFGLLPVNERILIITGKVPMAGEAITDTFWMARAICRWAGPVLIVLQGIVAFMNARSLIRSEKLARQKDPGRSAYLQPAWIRMETISIVLFILAIAIPLLLTKVDPMAKAIFSNILLLTGGGLTGYYALRQDTLLVQVTALEKAISIPGGGRTAASGGVDADQYAQHSRSKPVIAPGESERIIHQIGELMSKDKPYLNANYSMSDLCHQLHIPRRQLTYVLNEVMGKNFYGVVNEYRMKEAIRIMEESVKKYTMEAIAEMAGFQSKSSFYACFKKYTGTSPKEYLETKS